MRWIDRSDGSFIRIDDPPGDGARIRRRSTCVDVAQPAIGAANGLSRLLESLGIEPQFFAGHSLRRVRRPPPPVPWTKTSSCGCRIDWRHPPEKTALCPAAWRPWTPTPTRPSTTSPSLDGNRARTATPRARR